MSVTLRGKIIGIQLLFVCSVSYFYQLTLEEGVIFLIIQCLYGYAMLMTKKDTQCQRKHIPTLNENHPMIRSLNRMILKVKKADLTSEINHVVAYAMHEMYIHSQQSEIDRYVYRRIQTTLEELGWKPPPPHSDEGLKGNFQREPIKEMVVFMLSELTDVLVCKTE